MRALSFAGLLLFAAPLSAQGPTLSPQQSVLFAEAPAATPVAQPQTGFEPYSWKRAGAGAVLAATAAAVILRATYSDIEPAEDATIHRDRPYALVMIPAAILGYIVGGRTGARSTE